MLSRLRELIRAAEGGPWEIPILLAATTGARRGEVLALTWDDVDLEKGWARIEQAIQRIDGVLQIVPLKTTGLTGSCPFLPSPSSTCAATVPNRRPAGSGSGRRGSGRRRGWCVSEATAPRPTRTR